MDDNERKREWEKERKRFAKGKKTHTNSLANDVNWKSLLGIEKVHLGFLIKISIIIDRKLDSLGVWNGDRIQKKMK